MSDNETKLREALKILVHNTRAWPGSTDAIDNAERVLAETEPKHAAVVLFDEWWKNWTGYAGSTQKLVRGCAVHFFKAGMMEADRLASFYPCCQQNCTVDDCKIRRRIRDAANTVPI